MSGKQRYIGVDIGGSSVKLGIVDGAGKSSFHRALPLNVGHGRDATVESLFDEVERLVSDASLSINDVAGIGIAAPGTIDLPNGVILHPFNLPGYENLPLRSMFADRYGKPTALQNDANAAALGEYWVGAAKKADSLMCWTLGTGVGGGIVIGGKIVEGAHSHAGECGHTVLQMEGGPQSPFGIHGSVELYAGGRALVGRCEDALQSSRESSLSKLICAGVPITPREIAAAAEAGDALALELVMDTAKYLAIATVNIMHILNPEMVLIGGAMTFGGNNSPLGRQFLERLKSEVKNWAFPIPAERTRIEFAALGNDAGFIGAAACARALAEHP